MVNSLFHAGDISADGSNRSWEQRLSCTETEAVASPAWLGTALGSVTAPRKGAEAVWVSWC